ncbi:hypothetical protein M1N52_01270 [Thermodesulfovibrionales bacterium]|nr:hypothetical protein [Thermodesulfovibrionales bacterium]MCL0085900.1 hypothetical protein [Thermodesulfovibrionales bacterium]
MDRSNHPCFNVKVRGSHGRMHLPVAPRCNIQCKYCDRKYDCVNESRPGVTSAVLTPMQAIIYLDFIFEKTKNISVVGIAGPGDPFATPEETMETLRLVRENTLKSYYVLPQTVLASVRMSMNWRGLM